MALTQQPDKSDWLTVEIPLGKSLISSVSTYAAKWGDSAKVLNKEKTFDFEYLYHGKMKICRYKTGVANWLKALFTRQKADQ